MKKTIRYKIIKKNKDLKLKKGSFLTLTADQALQERITGLCVKLKNKGLKTNISIKTQGLNDSWITHKIPLYSPFIKDIKTLLPKDL